ncbi:hypothetical protein OIU85_010137 [Salix viminalis]|uniref:Uncharacterized protein n=1 Tax=Salix viminalis TaxID=40686 RepID=A0A9Q0NW06_SALVM|nr:hypothetical protein OIU85_010137 [Salix viminalis]
MVLESESPRPRDPASVGSRPVVQGLGSRVLAFRVRPKLLESLTIRLLYRPRAIRPPARPGSGPGPGPSPCPSQGSASWA